MRKKWRHRCFKPDEAIESKERGGVKCQIEKILGQTIHLVSLAQ